MKKSLAFGGETPKQLLEMLQSNADDTGEENFVRPYTETELAKKEKKYISGQKEYKKLNNKLVKFKKEMQGVMKPLKEENDQLMTNIEQKGEMVKEEVFYFIDRTEGKVGTYDSNANLISERFATPEEMRQTANMYQMAPAAEDRFISPDSHIEPKERTGTDDNEGIDGHGIDMNGPF